MSADVKVEKVSDPSTAKIPYDKKRPSPIPYVITFFILFLVMLGVLTWMLDALNKSKQCSINPNFWCYDTWTCNTPCPAQTLVNGQYINSCFTNSGPTGLASCLFGPTSTVATVCFTPQADSISVTGPANCSCVNSSSINCFTDCPTNLSSFNSQSNCCVTGTNASTNPGCSQTFVSAGVPNYGT